MRRSIAFLTMLALAACNGSASHIVPGAANFSNVAIDATCRVSLASPPVAPAYANTVWPSEKHDEWRTAAVKGGLPSHIVTLHAKSAKLPPVPVWGYVGLDGDLYVMGGQSFALDIYTKLILGSKKDTQELLSESIAYSETLKPYVAKIDPVTLATKILYLPYKHAVNYIGGMLVDSNGYLYATARGFVYKIDPKSLTIVASKRLPLPPGNDGRPNKFTAFNGFQAMPDGTLITKGFASLGGSVGNLFLIDPDDLSIKGKAESSEVGGARLVLARSGKDSYVYNAGATNSIRFLVRNDTFTLDSAFTQQYLSPSSSGSTEGTSEVYMGKGVAWAGNTTPAATTPMQIFAQAARDGSTIDAQYAFSFGGTQWDWEMPAGDPFATGMFAIQDQLGGAVAGFRACDGGASAKKVWENDQIAESVGMSIDVSNGQLYADDRHCVKKACTLALVVLDVTTGKEIARVGIAGTEPSIGQIFVGPNNAIYHLSTDTNRPNGWITRVTAN